MDDRAATQGLTPRRRAGRIAVAVVVTVGLTALIVYAVPYDEVAKALAGFDPAWLAPLLAAYVVGFVTRALRFRSLGVKLPLPALAGVSAIHQFFNRILPFRTGELAFPMLVRRFCGTSLVEGLAVVVLCRLLDLACVATAFLIALLGVPAAREAVGPAGTVLIAALLPVLVAGYLFLPSLGGRLARKAAARIGERRPGWAERLTRTAEALDGVRHISRRSFAASAGWTVLQWTATLVTFWSALASLGIALGPAEVVVGSTLAILAAVLPIGGVGSFGTLEGGWTAGFVLVGVPAGPALASALVLSGVTFAAGALLAGASWMMLSRSRSPAPDGR